MDKSKSFSNLLVLGKSLSVSENFEFIQDETLAPLLPFISKNKAKVLILHQPKPALGTSFTSTLEELQRLFTELELQSQKTEIIAILDKNNIESNNLIISILNPFSIFYTDELNTLELEKSILAAIRKYDYHQQNYNFYLLFQEQNEKLKELNTELEARIALKNTSLRRSQNRLLLIQEQLNLMYECIVGVQYSKTVAEIEDFLTEKLASHLQVNWIRILVGQKEIYSETFIIEGQKKFKIFGTPLYFGKKSIGHIYFAKLEPNFKKKDESFLLQLSEIVSIKINQLINYSDLVLTRSQWQQTFKAIKHQVTIIDTKYNVLNSNLALDVNNKKCYELLFNNSAPCEGCQLGKKFQLHKDHQWFNITSQKMKNYDQKNDSYINIYQNVTEQKTIEVKILEQTKLSDLGILAGSLAHELNNPLAGIITFLQLILNDPKNTPEAYLTDVQDLLDAALNCKSVIQSILESVRNNKSLDLEFE